MRRDLENRGEEYVRKTYPARAKYCIPILVDPADAPWDALMSASLDNRHENKRALAPLPYGSILICYFLTTGFAHFCWRIWLLWSVHKVEHQNLPATPLSLLQFNAAVGPTSRNCLFASAVHKCCVLLHCKYCEPTSLYVSMHVCNYVCMYFRTYVHTYIHTYIHAYMLAYMHACMHTCMHTGMHTCMHTGMHTCMHTWLHTGMHTCMHTGMHTGMHTCIWLQVFARKQPRQFSSAQNLFCAKCFLENKPNR